MMLGATMLVVFVGLFLTWARWRAFDSHGLVGVDQRLYSEIGRRWLDNGSIYADFQLVGPYRYDQAAGTNDVARMPTLYPPWSSPFFALSHLMPWPLWWITPIGVLGWLVASWRPRPWAWPLLALPLLWANTSGALIAGNTTLWVAMFVGLGLRYGWPAFFVALKPTMLPLVLVGWRDWRVWLGLAVLVAIGLPETGRAIAALGHVEGGSVLYSIADLPLVLVPIVGYLGARRSDGIAETPIERVHDRYLVRLRRAVAGDGHVARTDRQPPQEQEAV